MTTDMKRITQLIFPLLLAALALWSCGKIKSELSELSSDLNSLEERVSAIENVRLSAIEKDIASLQDEIAALKASDKLQKDDIDALRKSAEGISSEIAGVKKDLSALEDDADSFSETLQTIAGKIASLETQISSINEDIAALGEKLTSLERRASLAYLPSNNSEVETVVYTRDVLKIEGRVTLNFEVLPSSEAATLEKNWKTALSARASYAATKASGAENISLAISSVLAKDGILSVSFLIDNLSRAFIFGETRVSVEVQASCGGIFCVSSPVLLNSEIDLSDKDFITYLLNNLDIDGDGTLELDRATKFDVSNRRFYTIQDMISQMPALKELNCSKNRLTSLDLSANRNIERLYASDNSLTELDIVGLPIESLEVDPTVKVLIRSGSLDQNLFPVGQYVSIDGITGVVFTTGLVVSTDENACTWQNADAWCKAKGSSWDLPSQENMKTLYDNKSAVNSTLSEVGGTLLGSSRYWAADTSGKADEACYTDLGDGSTGTAAVSESLSVRAIRAL